MTDIRLLQKQLADVYNDLGAALDKHGAARAELLEAETEARSARRRLSRIVVSVNEPDEPVEYPGDGTGTPPHMTG